MQGINRRRVMGKSLPYDAEIEYLESTGTQWIDTGIDGNSIYGVELTFISANSVGAFDSILSCVMDDFTLGYFNGSNQMYLRNRGREVFKGVSITQSLENNLSMMDKEAIFNGVTYQISTPIASRSQNLLIANNSAYRRPAHAKFKSLKLYSNVLIRDFIPVRIGTTGYMYDKVSGQLFDNSGTGEFILGPDINSGNS